MLRARFSMNNYNDLEIYKRAYGLTLDIYRITGTWPSHEIFGLTSQTRRSAHSVDSNICEGASRRSNPDCLRFMHVAYSSLRETENHLKLAKDLGYLTVDTFEDLSKRTYELTKMINSFIKNSRAITANY